MCLVGEKSFTKTVETLHQVFIPIFLIFCKSNYSKEFSKIEPNFCQLASSFRQEITKKMRKAELSKSIVSTY